MRSTARSAMRLASSWMVIASGIVTSRDHLLGRHLEALRLLLLALGAAAEGGDRAGPIVILDRARWTRSACRGASRPRPWCASAPAAFTSRLTPGRGLDARFFLLGGLRQHRWTGKLLGGFLGLRWPSSSCGGAPPPRPCGGRRLRAPCARALRARPARRFLFLALALLGLAHARIGERAVARVLLFRRQRAQHDAGALLVAVRGRSAAACRWRNPRLGLELRLGLGARTLLVLGRRAARTLAAVSTTTVLVRPWENSASTRPCSTAAACMLRVRAAARGADPGLRSLVSFVSVMLSLVFVRPQPGLIVSIRRTACEELFSKPPASHRRMYHI